MKKITIFLFVVLASFSLEAQIETPAPSPTAKVVQTVGLTEVTLEYSRPAMRGRTIFGDLVPYDKLWRTGANKNSTITFSTDVTVSGKELKKGSYAIFATPRDGVWEVAFYSDTNNWGTPRNWDATKVAALVNAKSVKLTEMVESFTIAISNLTAGGADLEISWADTKVVIPFEVPSDATVLKQIEQTLAGPSAMDYYTAAVYYSDSGKDIAKAKEWMDKAMSMTEKPAFWQLRQQSLVEAKAGNKKAAIDAAKKSLAAAKEAGNDDYVKLNMDSLKEWGAM